MDNQISVLTPEQKRKIYNEIMRAYQKDRRAKKPITLEERQKNTEYQKKYRAENPDKNKSLCAIQYKKRKEKKNDTNI